jgi:hypothetical protein
LDKVTVRSDTDSFSLRSDKMSSGFLSTSDNFTNGSDNNVRDRGLGRSFAVCFNGPILPNEQKFDLNKSRQKFHHGLKEHHKISNIPKFRCEML